MASYLATTCKLSTSQGFNLVSKPTTHNNFTHELYERREQKLKEARRVLRKVREDLFEGLVMIDALQRLGIDYHFREEIQDVLHLQYVNSNTARTLKFHENDLYEVSTRFRLLRQEGYNVTSDVFDTFKDTEGRFKSELGADIRGLMGLYEASQLSIQGEDILDQASDFSSQHLHAWMTHLDPHEAKVVCNTLKQPYHKSLSRFLAKNFLSDYKGPNGWINVLQELANMDFNVVRSTYQKEILQVSKWWKEGGLAKELKFARDQPQKWYMWPVATLSHPSLSEQRVQLTKPISLVYIIDDIFDVYGTLEELTLFTGVVNRWELDAAEQLPDYMKICFKALQDITEEIANDIYKKHGWNPTDSLQRSWARLCNAFLIEAQWFASGEIPNAQEYLKNGIISSGVPMVLVHMFFLLGHNINQETVDYVDGNPGIITSTATILRLWDDLGSAKDENQDGHDGSYVECYMKDHKGSSVESARKHVTHLISEAWKCLNQECLSQNQFSPAFIKGCLNTARMVPLMYNYDDEHNLPILKEYMKSILEDSDPFEGSKKLAIHF